MFIPIIIVVVALLYIASVYNSFQTTSTRIDAAIQEIGNQLKRQASLIPNLEASVKGYMKHEKGIFASLTDARKAVEAADGGTSGKALDKVESAMNGLASKLQVIVESNPEIKADRVVSDLMNELRDTADKLMYARRSVIDLTQQYNQSLVTFPGNIFGSVFGFIKKPGIATPSTGAHVEVSEEETHDVKVSL
ncbi:MAG TPA: LemA family protein [Patescibacteria group bacterium]|nr:LemA family protein [Patescibacteria group bacterium]